MRRQVARAVFNDPRLFNYAVQPVAPIRIIVKSGRVTLEGVVDNENDKTVAGLRSREVPGTFDVDNQLVVERSDRRSSK